MRTSYSAMLFVLVFTLIVMLALYPAMKKFTTYANKIAESRDDMYQELLDESILDEPIPAGSN